MIYLANPSLALSAAQVPVGARAGMGWAENGEDRRSEWLAAGLNCLLLPCDNRLDGDGATPDRALRSLAIGGPVRRFEGSSVLLDTKTHISFTQILTMMIVNSFGKLSPCSPI